MSRFIAILLLCPLTVAAAEWRYDGRMATGGSSTADMATAEPESATTGMAVSAGPAPANAPGNNMTMSEVRASQGDPDAILEGVGDPPITRWQYPEYVVYFERDRVITSVAGRW